MDRDATRPSAPPAPTVLFVMPWSPDAIGGVSEVVANLYRIFAGRRSVRPRLLIESYPLRAPTPIATRALGPIDGFYLMPPTVPGERLRRGLAFLLRLPPALARLREYLRRHDVRAVNIHYPSLASLMLLLARPRQPRPVPVVLSFHGADINAARGAGGFDRWLWNVLIGRCDAAVACSQALAKEFLAVFPAAKDKVHVILNGIDGEVCRRTSRAAALPAALEGRRYLANLGTFEHKKGQDILLAAFRRIAATHPDLHLALVGRSGPTLAALQATAREHGLRGRVHFFVDQSHAEAMAILSRAELMAHPARQEPFGLVILEAASLGVPVIATGIGGIREIVEDRRSGRLVPPDDAEALAAAALEALTDPAAMRGYAAVLRKEAEDRFSWTRAAEAYAKLFRMPLGPGGSDAGPHSGR